MTETKKILILSGNERMLKRVRRGLSEKPRYAVNWTDSYDEAHRMVKEGLVDFLFYEVGKALEDGVGKLDAMKDANRNVPVVVSAVLDMPPPPGIEGRSPR